MRETVDRVNIKNTIVALNQMQAQGRRIKNPSKSQDRRGENSRNDRS